MCICLVFITISFVVKLWQKVKFTKVQSDIKWMILYGITLRNRLAIFTKEKLRYLYNSIVQVKIGVRISSALFSKSGEVKVSGHVTLHPSLFQFLLLTIIIGKGVSSSLGWRSSLNLLKILLTLQSQYMCANTTHLCVCVNYHNHCGVPELQLCKPNLPRPPQDAPPPCGLQYLWSRQL